MKSLIYSVTPEVAAQIDWEALHQFAQEEADELEALQARADLVPCLNELRAHRKTTRTKQEAETLINLLWDRAWLDQLALDALGTGLCEEWDCVVYDFQRCSSEVARTHLPLLLLFERAKDLDSTMKTIGRNFWVSMEERAVMLTKMNDVMRFGSVWQDGPEDCADYWEKRFAVLGEVEDHLKNYLL